MATADEFYTEWKNNHNWWFHSTPEDDAYIAKKYGHLLNDNENAVPSVASVVVFDQLPCHVFRGRSDASTLIQENRKLAVLIADEFIGYNGNNDDMCITKRLSVFDDVDFTFLMLPYRHTGDLLQCTAVAQLAWERLANQSTSPTRYLRSFIKATYERAPRDQKNWVDFFPVPEIPPVWDNEVHEDILEYAPVWLRWSQVSLKEIASVADALKKHPWPESDPIYISLSGGVDSMVIATVLRRLRPKTQRIIAVHVNYCNRDESTHEEAFVRQWAAVLEMPYYVRHITEIQRAQTKDFMRNTYERYTRDVRYSTYSYVAGVNGDGGDTVGGPVVVLGHHEDDAFENILTNIKHSEKFECLRGMEAISESSGPMGPIEFHRPLIRISKAAIYKAAWIMGIPYLQDSTPTTTQRGTIRDVIRPALESWDPCIVRRMLDMADVVGEFANSFEKDVVDAAKKTRRGEDGMYRWTTPKDHSAILSPRFWRRYCQRVLHVTPSWKSLENMRGLVDRLVKKSISTRVMLTKHVEVSMCIWSSNAGTAGSTNTDEFIMIAIQQQMPNPSATGHAFDTPDNLSEARH